MSPRYTGNTPHRCTTCGALRYPNQDNHGKWTVQQCTNHPDATMIASTRAIERALNYVERGANPVEYDPVYFPGVDAGAMALAGQWVALRPQVRPVSELGFNPLFEDGPRCWACGHAAHEPDACPSCDFVCIHGNPQKGSQTPWAQWMPLSSSKATTPAIPWPSPIPQPPYL